jgi:NAD(P)-dependent dehydrogenase (short-subunit alcohol dehydrogenase family)
MSDKGIVIVTGAASGIGLASARRLAGGGWRVAMLERDEAALAREAAALGGGILQRPLDVTDEAGVKAAVAAVAAEGRIAGLVNSAGIAANIPLEETTVELFRRILDVNVIGSFLVGQAVAAEMAKTGGGSIVNIASVSGMQGNVGRTAYGASKGAVITMTKVWAVELAERGIRVNAVSPGPVDTPMVEALHTTAERDTWLTHVPLRRYSKPEEIASGIAYLIDGEQSSYVTGQVLAIDGGFSTGGTIRPMTSTASPQ